MSFCNIAWALANWKVDPGDVWLRHFVQRCTPTVPSMEPNQVSVLLQALADMQYKPQKVCHRRSLFYHPVTFECP